jgi:hypothetical protein
MPHEAPQRRADDGLDRPSARATKGGDVPAQPGGLLALQRRAGNRAVSGVLARTVVQRAELLAKGGPVADRDGPGTNQRAVVLGVQDRLLQLWTLTNEQFGEDRKRVEGKTPDQPILAADIPETTAAIDRNDQPHLAPEVARSAFTAALVGGVGTGQNNDAADVELMFNLMHEEGYVTNADYDAGIIALTGTGMTIGPDKVAGFLPGLGKLKRHYASGFPFSGSMRTRTKPIFPEGTEAYQKALEHHRESRAAMEGWLKDAKAQTADFVLRNSAEWCASGAVSLFCLTPTHDSKVRVKAERKPKTHIALFPYPGGALGSPPAPYVRKMKGQPSFDQTNVRFEPRTSGGFQDGSRIAVIEPLKAGKQDFFRVIKHEAQHSADHHTKDEEGSYKTEVNARWVDGSFERFSPRRKVKGDGFTWNERQYAAFQDIMSHPELYPYAQKNWYHPNPAERAKWRRMVVAYTHPVTFNPINSVRVETLFKAIEAASPGDCQAYDLNLQDPKNPPNPKAEAVEDAMGALDAADGEAVKQNAELQQLAHRNLGGSLYTRFLRIR